MADDTRTLSPAYVWFAAYGERKLDVTDFSVDEAMSSPFHVLVHASSQDAALKPSEFVGKGAAFRFLHHTGDLVWAGICSEARQVRTQPHGAAKISIYEFTIVPALWRTALRRNNRIFQRMTVKEIVEKILGEWQIPCSFKDLKEVHRTQEYRVQYHESDFAFISRLLEEEGISYWFDHTIKSGPGSEVTSMVFSDKPETRAPVGLKLPYRAGAETFEDGDNVIFDVVIAKQMRFGKTTVRDFDFRLAPDMELIKTAEGEGAAAEELVYEDYQYLPGAFRAMPGDGDPTPIADNKGKVRTVDDQTKLRTEREIGADRRGQTSISLNTTALELAPGDVFAVGQNSSQPPHPNPQVPKSRDLLVVHRHIVGSTRGIRHQGIDAVPADVPHRPPRTTPRPRVLGVQSALVVGPKQQEINVDEFGRVRVQFHWDREGGFDDDSSCWMRVSQGWAGNRFGLFALPRVGHEVLVGFYEGDPDRPVVVGRAYNKTNGVPYELAKNKTKSGWRTESSGGDRSKAARGYHELMFEDAVGKEEIFLRSEGNLTTLVHDSEGHDVCSSRSTLIGSADITHVGKTSLTIVGEKTGFLMSEGGSTPDVILSTSGASVRLVGGSIIFDAKGEIHLHGGTMVKITSETGTLVVKGKSEADFDCAGSRSPEPAASKVPSAAGPSGGPQLHAPTYPDGVRKPLSPLKPFDEVNVTNAPSAAPAPAPAAPAPQGSRAAPHRPSADDDDSNGSNASATASSSSSNSAATSASASATPSNVSSPGASPAPTTPGTFAPANLAKAAANAVSPATPILNEVLSRGLQLAAGQSPFDVVKSMAMGELQKAFVQAEMAILPTQAVAKVNAIAQQVVGFVDLKNQATMLLKVGG